jgi:hypothetical protein
MLAEFRKLKAPSQEGAFRLGARIGPSFRVAMSHEGHLTFAIEVLRTGDSSPRHFENLRYDPPRELSVEGDDGARREQLATLVCRAREEALQIAFVRIATTILGGTEHALSEKELEARLDEFVSLFRALNRPATETIQGVWGELAVILWSQDPATAIVAWHSNPRALHDFAAGDDGLEVKTCGTGLREHEIRLDQLLERKGGRTCLASIVVAEADDGLTIGDLRDAIAERVACAPELLRRLEAIITRSLGITWREAATRRFDADRARKGLRFYAASDVPSVARNIPPAVSDVRFRVDLSNVARSSREALVAGGNSFFAAMIASL